MIQLKSLMIATSLIMVAGCSTINGLTDLNKMRSKFQSKKNQANIQNVANARQKSITSNDKTIYANGIYCLSEPFIANMKNINAINERNRQAEKDGQNSEIIRLQENLEKITKIGGFVEEKLNRTTGEIYVSKIFNKTINQYALEIADLTYQIEFLNKKATHERDFKKIRNLANKKHTLEFELEELKAHLDNTNRDLAQAQTAKAGTTQALEDIAETIRNGNDIYKVAVGNIYDKTGKVFPSDSTAISEMVAHALSYNYGIKLMDIPFSKDWGETRHNPLSGINGADLKQNPNLLNNSISGIIFPSDMYISGALVQYDDLPINRSFGTQMTVNIDPLDISSSTKTITIGMVLRMIGSNDALILDDGDTENSGRGGNRASVYVQNTYFVKSIGANVFEVKSKRLYGGRVSVEVSDPVNYAVRELVEAGVYEILKKSLRPSEMSDQQKQECDNLITNSKA